MKDEPKKGEAFLLLGHGDNPEEERAEENEKPDFEAMKADAAASVMKAVKSGDVEALNAALTSFHEACSSEEY